MPEILAKSPLSIVDFHGARVAFAFIITFKKDNHGGCNGQGFQKFTNPTRTATCKCAVDRARKRLIEVGRTAFEAEGARMFPPPAIDVRAVLGK